MESHYWGKQCCGQMGVLQKCRQRFSPQSSFIPSLVPIRHASKDIPCISRLNPFAWFSFRTLPQAVWFCCWVGVVVFIQMPHNLYWYVAYYKTNSKIFSAEEDLWIRTHCYQNSWSEINLRENCNCSNIWIWADSLRPLLVNGKIISANLCQKNCNHNTFMQITSIRNTM